MTAITILLCIFIIITLAIALYAYHTAFYMPKRSAEHPYPLPPGMTEDNMESSIGKTMQTMMERPCEEITITGHNDCQLFGRYYHTAKGAPVHILFHGYKSSPYIDCSGGTYLALKQGHNALAVDQRSQCKSDGHVITFGVLERKDCLCWINYVCERFGPDTPIILCGLSMGAATVLMAADQPLPANVKGIMADCPYSSPKAIIQTVCGYMKFPPKLMYPFIRLSAYLFGHFNLEESSAVEAVTHTSLPILLIHGEGDDFVPCDMSREIYAANKASITLVTVPEAGHGKSYLVAPALYEASVLRFLEAALNH